MVTTQQGTTLVFLDGTTKPVDGHDLSFGIGTLYVVNIGNVGDGSAAQVAAAANRAYEVADSNGIAVTAVRGGQGGIMPGEHLVFLGHDDAGRNVTWFFGNTSGAHGPFIPASDVFPSADTNGNHLVDPNEITPISSVIGAIPTFDFG